MGQVLGRAPLLPVARHYVNGLRTSVEFPPSPFADTHARAPTRYLPQFWMAGRAACQDGEEARRYDWFCDQHRKATMVSEIGAVRQIVAPGRLVSEFETSVAAAPMRVGGSMPVTIFGSIVSSAAITATTETPRGLEKTLEMADVEVCA